jgi:hypothetical protein
MPVFPQYNALFIHIPKNAGRSIEAALFPPGVGSASGRRSWANRAAHLAQNLTTNRAAPRFLVGTRDVSLSAQHLTLAEIRLLGLLPEHGAQPMFTFCVVRDPYARAISSVVHFRKRLGDRYRLDPRPSAAQIERALDVWADIEPLDHNLRAHRRPQADFVFGRDTPNAMDMTLRFERLEADFEILKARIGAVDAALPWIGRSPAPHAACAELLTPAARRVVERVFEADFERFGYDVMRVAA